NYYEHYQHLLPMIDKVYDGKNVSKEYLALEPSKQLIASMIACGRLANHLDKLQEEAAKQQKSIKELPSPQALEYMGNFLQYVSYENVLAAMRSHVTMKRIVLFNLDTNPHWKSILSSISKSVEG